MANNILDVRSFRDADVDSDHMLVLIKIRERISCRNPKRTNQRKFNHEKLKDPIIQKHFQLNLEYYLRVGI